MRLLALTAVVLVFSLGISYLILLLTRPRKINPLRVPWEVEEASDGEQVTLHAVRGEERLLIGAAPFAALDFDQQIENLRAEADYKVTALNNRRRLRR